MNCQFDSDRFDRKDVDMDKNDGAASLVRSDALLSAVLAPLRCDGSCEEHRGEVRPVECWGPGDSEPWRFNYCDEAVEEDKRRGFRVVEANKKVWNGWK